MNRAALSCVLLPLMACAESPVLFHDTVDLHFDFGFVQDRDAGLHEPYVQGSQFGFSVTHRRDRDMTGWRVISLDPDLFDLYCERYSPEFEEIECGAHAAADGLAKVIVEDDRGEIVGQTTIEVALPDRVDLLPHGPLIIDRPELIDESFQVLTGGTSTWLARYYLGDQRLHGNGTLSVEGGAEFDAWTEDSFLFEDRDWLQGSALSVGEHPVSLYVDGVHITDTMFTAVGEEAIDRVELHGMDESTAYESEDLVVLAQAYDVASVPIYAVEFEWGMDDKTEPWEGDLYRYEYNPEDPHTLSADVDGIGSSVTIHGRGYVDSTNNIGCSAVGGAGGLAGLLVGLLGVLRRRSAPQYPGPANR